MVEALQGGSELDFADAEQIAEPERGEACFSTRLIGSKVECNRRAR